MKGKVAIVGYYAGESSYHPGVAVEYMVEGNVGDGMEEDTRLYAERELTDDMDTEGWNFYEELKEEILEQAGKHGKSVVFVPDVETATVE